MKKFTNPLDNIRIASPCPASWDEMLGNERKRFCSQCNLNVYNLSGMTRDEAENLLLAAEGRVCVRFYRRQDGSVLTQDCPVGWQAVKRRISRTATAFVSLCAGIFTGIFAFNQPKTETPNAVAESTPVRYAAPPSLTQAVKSSEGESIVDRDWVGQALITTDVPLAGMPDNLFEVKRDIFKVRKDIKKKRKR